MKINEVLAPFHPKAWGFELLVDCTHCQTDVIVDKEKLIKFVRDLIKEIDMVAVDEPLIKHFPNRDPGKDGFSIIQLIETSSITCHCVDENRNAYIDAIAFIENQLKPKKMKQTFLTRDA